MKISTPLLCRIFTDCDGVYLTDLMVGSVLGKRATKNAAMKTTESFKSFTIVITIRKTVFPYDKFEQDVFGAIAMSSLGRPQLPGLTTNPGEVYLTYTLR